MVNLKYFPTIIAAVAILVSTSYAQRMPVSDNSLPSRKWENTPQREPATSGRSHNIKWKGIRTAQYTEILKEQYLHFEGATYGDENRQLPIFIKRARLNAGVSAIKVEITDDIYEELTSDEVKTLKELASVGPDIVPTAKVVFFRKAPYSHISFVPLRKNPSTDSYEKLLSFNLKVTPVDYTQQNAKKKKSAQYAANSVLSSGSWYKISVEKDGVHKIDYSFLQSLGISVSSINPKNIRICGNGGGMLPLSNAVFRHDDLVENAIQVVGESDNSFDQNDYILFYAQGPNQLIFSSADSQYYHQNHWYSDKSYYFLTVSGGSGTPKRIATQSSSPISNTSVVSFDGYAYHENDIYNLIKSGREWYGEKFDGNNPKATFPFTIPNVASDVTLKVSVVGRAEAPDLSDFTVLVKNGTTLLAKVDLNTGNVPGNYLNEYGKLVNAEATFSSSDNISVEISFNDYGQLSTMGWLNYIELNARRTLKMYGDQMQFSDQMSVGPGNISKFSLSNASSSVVVWEVTDPTDVKEQATTLAGTILEFTLPTDSLRKFITFNGGTFSTPANAGAVAWQDIHGTIGQPDFVIVTHPNFLSEANRLANFHRSKDNMEVSVVTTTAVYNEFSSGAKDITAIKDLMRMLYNRATDPAEMPRYLCLFGDGSYDNKNRLSGNTGYIPTYQSANSLHPVVSYVSDDYFGLLDDNEGEGTIDNVDIGIGRIPVRTASEATTAIDKVFHYYSSNAMGSWRNFVCFVGDDEDSNIHIDDADGIAIMVDTTYDDYDVDKIYFDAYKQESTPGGQRYPKATEAINRRVEKGALIINYTGHGGELGWAHERCLENTDINSWQNINNLPLFVTATCEFSRFDDPGRTAAGEYVYINSSGGGIALLSTVRLVTSGANKALTQNFYAVVFESINGEMPRLGDLSMRTKNKTGGFGGNTRKYALLGDPALMLAYPKHEVFTDSINGQAVLWAKDTIKALSKVTISGHVAYDTGGKYTTFNGTVYPTVYDKASTIQTLVNDPYDPDNPTESYSVAKNFTLQNNVLFKGKASVVNGEFTYSFYVPKDIYYQNGFGRISYYAENGVTDANGPYEGFIIGGSASNIAIDNTGPEIDLYMNDSNFVFGGITNESPSLLAYVFDEHGINTTGNGIGHDIVAILDKDESNPIVLNDDYEADRDSYKRGTISYPFSKLEEGMHNLSIKVWDVYNNSAQAYTEFVVAKSAELALSHVLNYPNPFSTYTEFWFEHNRPNENLDVQIQIFTVGGKLIKTLNANVFTAGFRPDPQQLPELQWDGRDDFGDKIGRGVYVYHLKVRAEDGTLADQYEKLVILN